MRTNSKGILLPEGSDNWLQGLEEAFNSAGTVVAVDSLATAQTMLATAEAAGQGPTVLNPWYFDVNTLLYKASGAKQAAATGYVLQVVNEVQANFDQKPSDQAFSLTSSQTLTVLTSSVKAVPYPRFVMAFGRSTISLTSGALDLFLRIGAEDVEAGRLEVKAGMQSVDMWNMGTIPAGQAPQVQLFIRGAAGTGTAQGGIHGGGRSFNTLNVVAFPVSAA